MKLIEKSNTCLQPELMSAAAARQLLTEYARARRMIDFGLAVLTRKVDDVDDVARATGTSTGQARTTIETGKALDRAPDLGAALSHGDVSLEQASEIAKAASSAPESVDELINVAREQSFQVLRDRARKTRLEAEQHRGLAERQHGARSGRSYSDELGMVHIHLAMEPHVGTPIAARAEAEAQRLARSARRSARQQENGNDRSERFECYVADAYARMLGGSGTGRAKRPELVVLVSHSVAKRGWKDVRASELCKIPGVGPVSPQVARDIAGDAFLTGVFYDGTDLRQITRWSRDIPVEVRTALELGEPPSFDGIRCIDCGNHFRTEIDHVKPVAEGGATSYHNLKPRCWSCHRDKTARDSRAQHARPARSRPVARAPSLARPGARAKSPPLLPPA